MIGRIALASLALILLLNQSVKGGTDNGKNPSDDLFDRLIAYCGEDQDQDQDRVDYDQMDCAWKIWDEVSGKIGDKFPPPSIPPYLPFSTIPPESQESQEMEMHMANWPKRGQ